MMAFSWFDFALCESVRLGPRREPRLTTTSWAVMIAIVSWLRLAEHEENEYGEGNEFERHEERAYEENASEVDRYGRREGLEAGLVNGGLANGGLANGGYGNGLATGGLGARYISTGGAYANGLGGVPMQQAGGGQVVYQQPGHNVVIQNGQVTQVPTGMPIQQGYTTGVPLQTGMGQRII